MQPYNGGNDPQRGGVYSTGHGFYNPYAEPEWKREKKRIRAAGNGIGLASVGYVAISFGAVLFLYAAIGVVNALRGGNFMEVGENAQWVVTLITYILSLIVPFGIYALCIQMPIGAAFPFRKMRGDITVGGIFVGLGAGIVASYYYDGRSRIHRGDGLPRNCHAESAAFRGYVRPCFLGAYLRNFPPQFNSDPLCVHFRTLHRLFRNENRLPLGGSYHAFPQ